MTWETDPDEPLKRCIRWSTVGAGIGLVVFVMYGEGTAPIGGWIIGYLLGWLFNDDNPKAE